MSPLDDELRAALRGRATALAPSPDPLAGIEQRAKRLQRNRIGAAVAGSVLAVALVAAVVPALQSSMTAPRPPQVAASDPPAPDLDLTRYALDVDAPQNAWGFRGRPVSEQDRALIQREYATRTGGSEVTVTPLYGGFDESAARDEVVFVADVDGKSRWGIASYPGEAGLEIVWDEPLPKPALALAAALPGDEGVGRLLLVAAPEVERVFYGSASDEASMAMPEAGVATGPLDRDPDTDYYRVLAGGQEVARGAAPDAEQPSAEPANLLEWPSRGAELSPDLDAAVLKQFTAALPGLPEEPQDAGVRYRPLFTGDTDGGVRYTIGQAWAVGGSAFTVAVAEGGTEGAQFFLGPKTDPGSRVLAYLLCCQPGTTVDTLVVVPQPGTGQVLYAAGPQAELAPVGAGQDFLDGVVLVDRDPKAEGDRLRLLDGDGDLDAPTFDGPVANLLCGLTSCS